MPEGTVGFANEPVMEVTAPIIEAQLVETYAINQIHLQSLLATKASRVRYAAGGKQVVDLRPPAHGIDAANKLARVSYLVGFDGTSNTMAAALYQIPLFGTMAHSLITCFESETEAFRQYAEAFPDSSTFLVDTYDSIEGVKKAITVAREMRERGHPLRAIRLDSGDLVELSRQARALLDRQAFPNVEIFASGGLDEFAVAAPCERGADRRLRRGHQRGGLGRRSDGGLRIQARRLWWTARSEAERPEANLAGAEAGVSVLRWKRPLSARCYRQRR